MDYVVIEWTLLTSIAMYIVVIGLPMLVVLKLIEAWFNVSEGVSLSAYYRRKLDEVEIRIEQLEERSKRNL